VTRKAHELNCEVCGDAFVFGKREQEFYREREWETPRCCPTCRDSRDPTSRDDREGEGFAATCSACGDLTTLPFVPATDRPIYCDPCFRNR
jgi:CxxC-x17-CxxC domain-containing protein